MTTSPGFNLRGHRNSDTPPPELAGLPFPGATPAGGAQAAAARQSPWAWFSARPWAATIALLLLLCVVASTAVVAVSWLRKGAPCDAGLHGLHGASAHAHQPHMLDPMHLQLAHQQQGQQGQLSQQGQHEQQGQQGLEGQQGQQGRQSQQEQQGQQGQQEQQGQQWQQGQSTHGSFLDTQPTQHAQQQQEQQGQQKQPKYASFLQEPWQHAQQQQAQQLREQREAYRREQQQQQESSQQQYYAQMWPQEERAQGRQHEMELGQECQLDPVLIDQIREDLEPWRSHGIYVDAMWNTSRLCPESPLDEHHCGNAYLRMTIDNGTLYMTSLADRGDDKVEMAHHIELPGMLLEIYEASIRHKLPNVDFTVTLSDEPSGRAQELKLPTLCSWKSKDSLAVLVPPAGYYRCSKDGVDVLVHKIAAIDAAAPWEGRKPVALGRHAELCPYWSNNGDAKFPDGVTPIGCPRAFLNNLSKLHPTDVDSHSHRPIIMEEQASYKYLMSTDGWSATSKLDKYLMLGSVVIKQDSPKYGWYYKALKPMVNYVPFYNEAPDDILKVVKALRDDDAKARQIAQAGRQLALKLLTRPARLCYWKHLLEHMAALQRYKSSCRLHRMCVLASDELNFLGNYEHSHHCNLHKEMDVIHGFKLPHAMPYKRDKFGGLNSTFDQPGWSLHEYFVPLQPEETVADWKPPW